MELDFQATFTEQDDDFHPWEIKPEQTEEEVPEVDPQLVFAEECARLRQLAEEEGYQAGYKKAEEEIAQLRNELQEWIDYLQNPLRMLDKSLSIEIVQTIQWLCTSCIGLELSLHPEKIMAVVDEIKQELPTIKGNKQLSMHPKDAEWLRNQLEKQKFFALTEILVEDGSLERGDFYLRSEFCELDGRLQTRLQQIFLEQFNSEKEQNSDIDSLDGFL